MIKLIVVGKIKEQYLKNGILDYLLRVNKYHKVELIEVMDSNIIDEGIKILKYIDKRDYVVTLEIGGTKLSSLEFSKKIDKLLMENSNITFIIGGSTGISDSVKRLSNYALSFSNMTFPHGLFRIIFLEQLYRCFKIMNNESYHK